MPLWLLFSPFIGGLLISLLGVVGIRMQFGTSLAFIGVSMLVGYAIDRVIERRGKPPQQCLECGRGAVWIRSTQFAGDHPYCARHAMAQPDFGQGDASYFMWRRAE